MNYNAQGNPCTQFPAKEVCRNVKKPTAADFQKVKKLARLSVGLETVKFCYVRQSEAEARELKVFVDCDWAGCVRSRRSTSGGIMKLGRHRLRTLPTIQLTVAMS